MLTSGSHAIRGEAMTRCQLRFPFLFAALACVLPAQGEASAPKPKPDPEVAKLLAELKPVVADHKMEHDEDGRKVIDQLLTKLKAGMVEKDKEAFAKAMDVTINTGKLRDPEKPVLYTVAIAALGELGKDGSKALKNLYDGHRIPDKREWLPVREQILKCLGKTKDESMIKFLVDRARLAPEASIQAAAGEALGNFDKTKQSVRDDIVKQLLARYGEIDGKSHSIDPGDIESQNNRERLAVISDKWNTTLGKLTGQNFRTQPEWQAWYNKNKNTEWK
jgi:HEAT repeats